MFLFITKTSIGAFSFQAAYFGVLLFQFVYILMQLSYLRRKEYGYYLLYILGLAGYYLAANESLLEAHIFFTRFPGLQPYFDKPLVILSSFFYYRFARHFLDIPLKYPKFNKQVIQMEYFLLFGIVAELLFVFCVPKSVITEAVFVFLSTFTGFYSLFLVFKFRQIQHLLLNNFILVGAFLIVLGAFGSLILFNLAYFGWIPSDTIPTIPSQIASVLELLIFTTALGYKTFLMEREKLKAERALVKELRENENLLHNIQQLRNKIASDLHDDMGATLGSINVYADVSERMVEEGNTTDAKNYLNRIVELSKESLSDMRNMIWALNPERDSMEDLVHRMKDFAYPLLTAKGIALKFEIDKHLLRRKISVLQKRNLFLIFKEAIHNIIKYAECKQVEVTLHISNNDLYLIIHDEGRGFDINAKSDGNGLANLHRRATEMDGVMQIKSEVSRGTTIQLRIGI